MPIHKVGDLVEWKHLRETREDPTLGVIVEINEDSFAGRPLAVVLWGSGPYNMPGSRQLHVVTELKVLETPTSQEKNNALRDVHCQ
jgi:hypothetical protein